MVNHLRIPVAPDSPNLRIENQTNGQIFGFSHKSCGATEWSGTDLGGNIAIGEHRDVTLAPGCYDFEARFFCTDMLDRTRAQGFELFDDRRITWVVECDGPCNPCP